MRRNRIINNAVRQRFAVTMKHNESTFAGVLTDFDSHTFVFAQCTTVPAPGETAEPLSSPVIVDRDSVAYLQELSS